MACFGFPALGRCPRCGAARGQRRGQAAANAARAGAARSCATGCAPSSASQELYTGAPSAVATPTGTATCCDPYCGCREYPAAARNGFWPEFAHPRWLPCDALYSGNRRRR